jgi:hypothetical protein
MAGLSSLLLPSVPMGVQGVTCIVVVAEAVMHRGRGGFFVVMRRLVDKCGLAMVLARLFPTVRGLEDGCVVPVSCQWRTLASIASSRCRALRLLHRRALEQRVDLTLCLASLEHHRLWEPSEQSCHRSYVLAHLGEAWESVIILDDSPVHVVGMHAHLITVLCNLMLECWSLLLQMESRGFELLLSLPQLVHMWVGRDFRIRRSPMTVSRMRGSPVPPVRGAVVGTRDVSLEGHLTARVVNDVHHEAFT